MPALIIFAIYPPTFRMRAKQYMNAEDGRRLIDGYAYSAMKP